MIESDKDPLPKKNWHHGMTVVIGDERMALGKQNIYHIFMP